MEKRKNLILYVVLLGLMIALPQTAFCWLTGWDYQREITLDTAAPENDFQVKVELTSANFDYSHALDNGEDLRFTDTSDNLQDYWIEEWDTLGTSTIWVEVATSGTLSFYLYYGNALASDDSDGFETFEFFDDSFATETIDGKYLTNWTKSGSNPLQDKTCQNWIISVYNNYNSEDKIYLFEQRDANPSNDIECWSFSRTDANTPANWTDEGVVFTSSQAWADGHIEPHGIIFETQAMADAREEVDPGVGTPKWRMYYCGKEDGAPAGGIHYATGFAVASESDLTSWTVFATNPVYNYDATQGYADPKVCIYNDEVWVGEAGYHPGVSADPQFFTVSSDGISSWNDKTKNWNPEGMVLGTLVPFTEGILITGRSSDRIEYNAYFTTDGNNKATYSGNPILTAGSGEWDQTLAWATIVVDKYGSYDIGGGGTYYMYYTAWNGPLTNTKLGLATSTTLTEESESSGFVKWNSTGSPIISGGIASLDDSGAVGIIAKSSFGMNHSLRFRANLYSPVSGNYSDFGLHGWDDAFDVNIPYEVFAQRYARSYMDILTTNTGYIADLGTTYTNAYHKYEITRKATSNEWFIDDISQATESNPSTVDLSPMFCENIYPPASGYEKADIDWAFVRKYYAPDPWASVGEETTSVVIPPSNVTITISGDDVILNWEWSGERTTYNVYRSTDPYEGFATINTFPVFETTYTDIDAAIMGTKYFYYITANE
ncbi:MAG: DUF2341 domain-containing protein [Candidatus Cloacimonetes bacterium]|nr:DUF2341 domain-containing protein [Candidatus Cloacimonadota bacterium]